MEEHPVSEPVGPGAILESPEPANPPGSGKARAFAPQERAAMGTARTLSAIPARNQRSGPRCFVLPQSPGPAASQFACAYLGHSVCLTRTPRVPNPDTAGPPREGGAVR